MATPQGKNQAGVSRSPSPMKKTTDSSRLAALAGKLKPNGNSSGRTFFYLGWAMQIRQRCSLTSSTRTVIRSTKSV
ncbi:hypothetical protein [Pseudomonas sp. P867]|uniref:hypothetical protein n=1 Tax=Pseudomonas sp. P867 TaxID=2816050 RepID=UPI00223AF67E|nr:hypothetical protein [Pseudomonas sp. P867]